MVSTWNFVIRLKAWGKCSNKLCCLVTCLYRGTLVSCKRDSILQPARQTIENGWHGKFWAIAGRISAKESDWCKSREWQKLKIPYKCDLIAKSYNKTILFIHSYYTLSVPINRRDYSCKTYSLYLFACSEQVLKFNDKPYKSSRNWNRVCLRAISFMYPINSKSRYYVAMQMHGLRSDSINDTA